MAFPGQGYTMGGYPPPPPQGYAPPPPPNMYTQYPPPSPYGAYPPPLQQQYPPSPYGQYQQQQPYPPPQQSYPPTSHPPPAYTPNDPPFLPSDPNLSQANYPQPPQSMHNPYSVPYGQRQANTGDYIMHVDPRLQNMPPPQFQLSNCQGRKRALLIGINYFGTSSELKGCINDVHNMKHFLTTLYNFNEGDMVILTDDQANPQCIPTKQNMLQAMQWLVNDARPNDSFFFHFSGHGGRMKDYDGDEDDGYDETIYPVDHASAGQIVDDMMHDIMVKPLVAGCRLTAIFDSCHSGTALDLPYVYSTKGALKEHNFFKDSGSSLMNAGKAYMKGDASRAISSVMSIGNKIISGGFNSGQKQGQVQRMKGSAADVIMLSGCKDDQTSADANEAGRATGAMSFAITTALRSNRNQTYIQLLNSIRDILRARYSQRPQLSSSHPMDMNLLFVI